SQGQVRKARAPPSRQAAGPRIATKIAHALRANAHGCRALDRIGTRWCAATTAARRLHSTRAADERRTRCERRRKYATHHCQRQRREDEIDDEKTNQELHSLRL